MEADIFKIYDTFGQLTFDQIEEILSTYESFKNYLIKCELNIEISFDIYEQIKNEALFQFEDENQNLENNGWFNDIVLSEIMSLLSTNNFIFCISSFQGKNETLIFTNRNIMGDLVIIKNDLLNPNNVYFEYQFNNDEKNAKKFPNINKDKLF